MPSTSVPMPSATIENTATRRRTSRTEPRSRAPADSWARIRSVSAVRRPTRSRSSSVEPVMNPNPPTWMRPRITNCPKGLQYVAVSTTTRPVTHTADVAVNSAVTGVVHSPDTADSGRVSRPVPMAIRTRNPRARTSAGRRGGRRMARATSTRIASGAVRCTRTRRSPGRVPCRIAIAGVYRRGTAVRGRGAGPRSEPDRPESPRTGPGWSGALVRDRDGAEHLLHALQAFQLAGVERRRPQARRVLPSVPGPPSA